MRMSVESDKQRLVELQAMLAKAEKAPLLADLDRVGWVYQAYASNASLLYRQITDPHPDFEVAIETRVPGFKPEIYRKYYAEMIRLILNYSASAASLVDHMRILSDKMEGANPDVYEELIERRTRLADTSVNDFVKRLRNFVLHYGLPIITGQISHTQGDDRIEFDTLPDPDQLRIWGGWKGKSREYMEQNNPISLSKTIADYDDLVRPFYDWVFEELKRVCYENAKRVSDLSIGINNIEARLAK